MKKLLLSSVIALFAVFSANRASAQLPAGALAPDWTYTDLDGNTQHLYALLDAGKTVIIDISATWCGPCWGFHTGSYGGTTGGIKSVTVAAGGSGYPSVGTTVSITGTGSGATAHAVIASGVVTSIVIDTYGSGYTGTPTVTVTGSGGSGAAAVAVTGTINAMDDVWEKHGPTGAPGVSSSTTNNVVCFLIEGDVSTTTAELHGGSGSQGDWVTGTRFPIIDVPSTGDINGPYALGGYPSFYVICPNRMISYSASGVSASMNAAFWMGKVGVCPAPATSALDAAILTYNGQTFAHSCDAVPLSVTLQNNSTTALTSATVSAFDGATPVGTPATFSGSLATYETSVMNLGTFTTTATKTLTFKITAGGGTITTNDQLSKQITELSGGTLPVSTSFGTTFPGTSWIINSPGNTDTWEQITFNTGWVGANATMDALQIRLNPLAAGEVDEVYLPEMNLSSLSTASLTLSFYVAAAELTATDNDALKVMVSSDCGANWTEAYNKSGSALGTVAPTGAGSYWAPTTAAMWRHELVDMSAYASKTSVMVKFVSLHGAAFSGNDMFLDEVNLFNSTGIAESELQSSLSIFPNPSVDGNFVIKNQSANSTMKIKVTNLLGQTVEESNVTVLANGNSLNLSTQPEGVYLVTITSGDHSVVKKVTIAK